MRTSRQCKRMARLAAAGMLAAVLTAGCRAGKFELSSPDAVGGKLAQQSSCKGAGISPTLKWSAPPKGTASLALIVTDPDAPEGTFVHWVLYDLPADARQLAAGQPATGQLTSGTRQGRNDFGGIGYGAACPPGANSHRYIFTLYALNTRLNLPAGVATRGAVETAMKGHTLARSELVALFP